MMRSVAQRVRGGMDVGEVSFVGVVGAGVGIGVGVGVDR